MTAGRVILGLLAVASIAAAPSTPLDAAFGNTIVTTYPDGKSTRMWLHRDGTYDGKRANGSPTAGVWDLKKAKLCITQHRPFRVPVAFCTPLVTGGVGTTWRAKGLKGEPVVNTLVAGRQG
ncbi:MAG: hypothetical protein Q8L23_10220 [Caulobacter sp.]|nr:hypothetical protein [Caulobacter sp.]